MKDPALSVSERISKLVPYQPGKPIDDVKRELGITGDIVKLASNENPLGPSPKALAALRDILPTLALYPDGGSHALRKAVSTKLGVPEDWLLFGNGSDEVIHLLGLTFLEPGDEIIVGDPTFSLYETAATLAGATTVKIPLTSPDFAHDCDKMAAAITEKTRLIFIANPHNPTGSTVDRKSVDMLLEKLPARAFLVLDEAYVEYIDESDSAFPFGLEYLRQNERVVLLRTFSKMYGLAGLRVGFAVARPEIVALLNQARSPFNVNLAGQVAAAEAILDDDWVLAGRANNAAGMIQLTNGSAALGLTTVPSRANFLLIDTKRPCLPMFEALLKRGVIVRAFKSLPTFLRVTVGTSAQNTRFLAELAEALTEIPEVSA